MRGTGRSHSRLLMMVLALCLLSLLSATRAEAGHRSHFSFSVGYYSPYFWGHYWVPPFRAYSYPFPYGGYYPAALPARDVGAIRLRVKPKKTEVFVDGDFVGRAGQYDGYPGYLWLDKGSHTLVFYRQGFRTFARTFEVRAGMVTDVRVEMEPGETAPPEEFLPQPRQRAPARSSEAAQEALPARPAPPAEPGGSGTLDLRREGARIRVAVAPGDASVYLDSRFLGTGEDLSRLHGGLMLDEGEHLLEVVHPDFLSDRVTFRAKAGEEIELRVTLDTPAET